jgi:hypothetical protein
MFLFFDSYRRLCRAGGFPLFRRLEPSMIRLLPSGEPGADVILYGKNWVYTLRMEPMKRRSALYGQQLDSKLGGPGVELCVHEFRDTDYVGAILTHILAHEGIPLMSWEDVEEWHKRQDFYPRNGLSRLTSDPETLSWPF